jgi:hypothetical protein
MRFSHLTQTRDSSVHSCSSLSLNLKTVTAARTSRGSLLTFGLLSLALGLQTSIAQTLHFRSGFEPGSTVIGLNPPGLLDVTGVDNSIDAGQPHDWVADLDNDARLGNYSIQLQSATDGATATIINDPTGSNRGKVMQFWGKFPDTPAEKLRVQGNVYGNPTDFNEVTSAVKMYLHPNLGALESKPEAFGWFTLQEWFTNPIFDGRITNFALGLELAKNAGVGQKLYWRLHTRYAGSNTAGPEIWDKNTSGSDGATPKWASDVLGQWVTLVMYHKKGNETTGRIKLKLIKADGTVVELFNVTDWTYKPDPQDAGHNQNVGMTHHNPFKLYTGDEAIDWIRNNSQGGNGAAIIYWDDWSYFEGDAYTNYTTGPFTLTAPTVTSAQVSLAWSNVPSETGFRIERKTGAGAYAQLAPPNKAPNILTHNDMTVAPSTTYTYRVRAENGNMVSEWSPALTVTTPASGGGDTSLKARWKLDSSSGTSAPDSSGNSNNGTTSGGPTWVAGHWSNALNFDGADDLVTAGSGATLDNLAAITVCAWIKPSTMGEAGYGRIIQKGTGANPSAGWRFSMAGTNGLSVGVDYATTDLVRQTANSVVAMNTWQHVAFTWTGSATASPNLRIYKNGAEVGYSSATNGSGARGDDGAANVYLGNDNTLARTFAGALDDVRVYNRVLTAAELLAIYQSAGN